MHHSITTQQLPPIANLDEMAELVKMSKGSLAGVWKQWPHFYVGTGRNAKGARFIPADVIAYLYENGGFDVRNSLPNQEGATLQGRSVSGRSRGQNKTRVSNQKSGSSVGTDGNKKTYYENPDRHELRLCG
ncbi:hypothetical protein [Halodesulfovibrio sp. MK-HDV]|uniref:hypothetical protein n=1 Tax=Halodesulfovibrio sp. MK-HDV TaxID=2599925 RepID=UPI0013715CC0|nr:hypothetical protein [Halodesulfovibrio sp. MK-HDV]